MDPDACSAQMTKNSQTLSGRKGVAGAKGNRAGQAPSIGIDRGNGTLGATWLVRSRPRNRNRGRGLLLTKVFALPSFST